MALLLPPSNLSDSQVITNPLNPVNNRVHPELPQQHTSSSFAVANMDSVVHPYMLHMYNSIRNQYKGFGKNLKTLEAPHSVGSLESSHTDVSATDARYC